MNFAPTLRADAVMATVPEYRLDMLGPWKSAHGAGTEAEATIWESPDPLRPDGMIYYSETTQRYTNSRTSISTLKAPTRVTLASHRKALVDGSRRHGSSSRTGSLSQSGTPTRGWSENR